MLERIKANPTEKLQWLVEKADMRPLTGDVRRDVTLDAFANFTGLKHYWKHLG